ncbi:hypothetical protein RBH20_19325 [Haloarcula sp. H-GB4]|uniref:hypothetical protein n=1 Tax=unclassified Haloarcula TaxID=2624677 RepID=UPI00073E7BF2|nr:MULTISPECIES: hypothetical protein [unclassified Haloarcula]MDQ2074683.1 hypothetical protein [Haloarcula sp. H-GB4]
MLGTASGGLPAIAAAAAIGGAGGFKSGVAKSIGLNKYANQDYQNRNGITNELPNYDEYLRRNQCEVNLLGFRYKAPDKVVWTSVSEWRVVRHEGSK